MDDITVLKLCDILFIKGYSKKLIDLMKFPKYRSAV